MLNKQIIFKKRPVGIPKEDTWELIETEIPTLLDGEFLVECNYVSLDPAMRGWMNNTKSYIEPVKIDDVMRAGGVGKVIQSKNEAFKIGVFVFGYTGIQQYIVTNGSGFRIIDTKLAPISLYLGALGMTGMTAYFGILEVGKLKEGDNVLISGAAGAVGSVAGQIAKIKNCKVVGIAGGKEKCAYLINELGFDAAIDYKNDNVKDKIKEYFPKGIDVFYDNVGGELLDLALGRLALHARIVICGAISQYNNTTAIKGPSNYMALLVRRATMQGMVVFDYAKKYGIAANELGTWIAEGKIKSKESVFEGIENFHEVFLKLFSGDKLGKLILKVKE